MSDPKRRPSRAGADKKELRRYRREQSRHWPTGGDLTLWQLLKLVLFGREK